MRPCRARTLSLFCVKAILEGLQILIKYDPDGSFNAEHDEVFAGGPPPDDMTLEDVKRLHDLNWRWKPDFPCWAKFT